MALYNYIKSYNKMSKRTRISTEVVYDAASDVSQQPQIVAPPQDVIGATPAAAAFVANAASALITTPQLVQSSEIEDWSLEVVHFSGVPGPHLTLANPNSPIGPMEFSDYQSRVFTIITHKEQMSHEQWTMMMNWSVWGDLYSAYIQKWQAWKYGK